VLRDLREGSISYRIAQALRGIADGMTALEIAQLISEPRQHVSSAASSMVKLGYLASKPTGSNSHRYWLPAVAPAGAKMLPRKLAPVLQKAPTKPRVVLAKPGYVAPEPKVTIAPPFVDRRFVPDQVTPLFSALGPGRYVDDA
jgi:hypothetical protein